MKSKSLILMVVAMGCGLVAAYTTAKLTAKGADETEKVLVASNEIKIGTVIKEPEKLFVEMEYKKGTAPNAVCDLEKFKDKVVTRTVRPGQFVVPDDLSANFGITPPKGHKAMAIKVDPQSAVGGFVMPGSRVDVLATLGDHNTKPKVLTVLQNAEVLAVDRISVRPDGQSAVESIGTVTLAVTPNNAQKLELALRMSGGIVRLLLRDQNDNVIRRVNPLESLNDSSADFGAEEGLPTIRALAARDDYQPGTKIEDPEKFFVGVTVQNLPASAYPEADIAKLKGLVLSAPLFKDAHVTTKHFGGKDADAVANAAPVPSTSQTPAEPVRHVLFIQNGNKEPQMHVFQDGMLVLGDQSQNTPKAPAPKTEKKPESKPENKPEDKPETKEDKPETEKKG